MQRGIKRLVFVLSIIWLLSVSGYAVYEWKSSPYENIFFNVTSVYKIPHTPGKYPFSEIVTFRCYKFLLVLLLPVASMWVSMPVGQWIYNGFKT